MPFLFFHCFSHMGNALKVDGTVALKLIGLALKLDCNALLLTALPRWPAACSSVRNSKTALSSSCDKGPPLFSHLFFLASWNFFSSSSFPVYLRLHFLSIMLSKSHACCLHSRDTIILMTFSLNSTVNDLRVALPHGVAILINMHCRCGLVGGLNSHLWVLSQVSGNKWRGRGALSWYSKCMC